MYSCAERRKQESACMKKKQGLVFDFLPFFSVMAGISYRLSAWRQMGGSAREGLMTEILAQRQVIDQTAYQIMKSLEVRYVFLLYGLFVSLRHGPNSTIGSGNKKSRLQVRGPEPGYCDRYSGREPDRRIFRSCSQPNLGKSTPATAQS